MEATVASQPFNEAQLFILKVFSRIKDEEEKAEIQAILLDYYNRRLKDKANEFWEQNNLDNAKMEELMYGHLRSSKK